MQTKAHMKATNKWMANSKDRITTLVPKGRKAEIQALAAAQGKSLNQYVTDAIDAAEYKQDDSARPWDSTQRQQPVDISNGHEKAD